ncbi:MAG: SDR family oxidoreductase [Verrucomicrobiota bacterium]
MQLTDNTVLITGGGSGIGRGLAEALHALGNTVIIAGRRQELLDETADANPGMASVLLDVQDPEGLRAFAAEVTAYHPELNIVINNAGIMRREDLTALPESLADSEAIITTNLLGPIRLTAALLPHLRRQRRATIINVSSDLAFVPLPLTPTYCATKAALHSYTQSLRFQLRDTPVEVIELIPPGVQTELMPTSVNNPMMMPLDDFIRETMALLKSQPGAPEICVERVKPLRFAAETATYDAAFQRLSQVAV